MFRFFRDISGGISYLRHFGVRAFLKKIPVYFRETKKTKENEAYFQAKYVLKKWEPSQRFDFSEILEQALEGGVSFRIAFFVHVYYLDIWEEIAQYLKSCPLEFDLFVNISDREKKSAEILAQKIQSEFLGCRIFFLPNRGRNFGPFFEMARQVDLKKYQALCHIHTKKSPQRGKLGQIWQKELLSQTLSPQIYPLLVFLFSSEKAGLLGPQKYYYPYDNTPVNNQIYYPILCEKLGIFDKSVEFFAGSMFWSHPALLEAFLGAGLCQSDFEEEMGGVDGKLEHAVERVWGALCRKNKLFIFATNIDKIGNIKIWKSVSRKSS